MWIVELCIFIFTYALWIFSFAIPNYMHLFIFFFVLISQDHKGFILILIYWW